MMGEEVEIVVPENILENWQEILNSLARLANIPAALIMRLHDADIEVFVASQSKENPYHPGDHERFQESGLYCETAIRTQDKLLVPDALADDKWKNNPDKKLGMIAYLGFPLLLPSKQPFGTICVLDSKRNEYSEALETLMLNLKKLIETHLELIYMNAVLGDKSRRLTDYLMELQTLRGIVPICAHCKSIRDKDNQWHPVEHYLVKHPQADFSHGICPACMKKLYPEVEEETP